MTRANPTPQLLAAAYCRIAGGEEQNTILELVSVVDRLQFHAVVVDHTEGGDGPATVLDELESLLSAVYGLVLVHRHRATLQRHGVIFPDLLQIREIRDNRCLLTTVRQVNNEVLPVK